VTRLTRRALLGAAAGAALVRPGLASAAPSELATMLALMHREDAAAAAYTLAAATTRHALLERCARIDERHAHALRVGLEGLTIVATPRPAHAERADPAAARLAGARAARAALEAAIALEEELLAAFVDATRSVADAGLVKTVATIAGSHAQQLAVLRSAAGIGRSDEVIVSGR
jgi:hypothetical protein